MTKIIVLCLLLFISCVFCSWPNPLPDENRGKEREETPLNAEAEAKSQGDDKMSPTAKVEAVFQEVEEAMKSTADHMCQICLSMFAGDVDYAGSQRRYVDRSDDSAMVDQWAMAYFTEEMVFQKVSLLRLCLDIGLNCSFLPFFVAFSSWVAVIYLWKKELIKAMCRKKTTLTATWETVFRQTGSR